MAPTATCDCSAEKQTADHVLPSFPDELYSLTAVNENLASWLTKYNN